MYTFTSSTLLITVLIISLFSFLVTAHPIVSRRTDEHQGPGEQDQQNAHCTAYKVEIDSSLTCSRHHHD